MPRVARRLAPLIVALFVGCNSQPFTPNTPSAAMTSAAALATGASIAGNVISSFASAPLKVGVAGTSFSTMTRSEGHFALSGVPAGHVTLLFEGTGVDARLPLGTVRAGDRVTIVVTVNGSTAILNSRDDDHEDEDEDDDDDDGEEDEHEVEGRVSSLAGSCPDLTFKIGNTSVKTSVRTTFEDVTCGTLANDMRIEAEGPFTNGVLDAKKIEKD